MTNRDLIFPLVVVPVAAAFLLIGLMLFFDRNNKKLLTAKLRTGAFLLSFSWFVSCGTPQPTCYDVAPANNSPVFNMSNSKKAGDTVNGHIYGPTYPYYAVVIEDKDGKQVLQSTLVSPKEDSLTAQKNQFYFILDPSLPSGYHQLRFYGEEGNSISRKNLLDEFPFSIQ